MGGSLEFLFQVTGTDEYDWESIMNPRILIDRFTLLDLVHDRWFALESFTFDREKQEAQLFLGERRNGPYNEKILKITDVLNVEIDDEAQIGIYDLADIQIAASSIRLESAMSLVITLTIGVTCEISLIQNPGNNGS